MTAADDLPGTIAALDAHDIRFMDLGDYPLELDRDAKMKLAREM